MTLISPDSKSTHNGYQFHGYYKNEHIFQVLCGNKILEVCCLFHTCSTGMQHALDKQYAIHKFGSTSQNINWKTLEHGVASSVFEDFLKTYFFAVRFWCCLRWTDGIWQSPLIVCQCKWLVTSVSASTALSIRMGAICSIWHAQLCDRFFECWIRPFLVDCSFDSAWPSGLVRAPLASCTKN